MTRDEFSTYLDRTDELAGSSILSKYSVNELYTTCNGVGAAWMDCVKLNGTPASDLMNTLLPWAIPASIIHDVRYKEGGGYEDRLKADNEFYQNLLLSIGYKFWTFRFWKRRFLARRMYRSLRLFGAIAFHHD